MIQKLIDANELKREMCRKCIDTDEETEKGRAKWDSGLWIRYKVFEDTITLAPRVDAVEVVRCKDCKFFDHSDFGKGEEYWCKHFVSTDDYTHCHKVIEDDFCAWGERREDAETN